MIRSLHHDWEVADLAEDSWNMPEPYGDIKYALEEADFREAKPFAQPSEKVALSDIGEVVRYHISHYGEEWFPGDGGGTELDMYLIVRLVDGRWASVVGYNDYTGWGCQSGADVRIGDTEAQVVEYGLDNTGRKLLGYVK